MKGDVNYMSSWILQLNPNVYRFPYDLDYTTGNDDWWGISSYFNIIKPGETAYVWQSIDYRRGNKKKPRGVYAKATVVSVPKQHSIEALNRIEELLKKDDGLWQDREAHRHQKEKLILLIRYDAKVQPPLTAEEIINVGLNKLGVLRFTHAEIYKLSDSEAAQIDSMVEDRLLT